MIEICVWRWGEVSRRIRPAGFFAPEESAQNMAVVIILPVLALIAVRVTRLVWFTPLLTLALALGISIVDIIALRVAVRLF